MDPLSAFSLAAVVCQFVEYATKIVSKGNKLRKSADGLLVEHRDLLAAIETVTELNNRLVRSAWEQSQAVGHQPTEADYEIQRACKAINQVASDLIETLKSLKLADHAGRWRSMRQAVKAVAGKSGIDKMKNDLAVQRERLDTALLSSLWLKMNDFVSSSGFATPLTAEMQNSTIQHLARSSHEERPPTWQTNLAQKVLENEWTIRNKANIKLFSMELSTKAAKDTDLELQRRIIRHLYFEDLSDREYRINAAHCDTFNWIYDGLNNSQVAKWCPLAPWLQAVDKMYWITGKPGSGKSTLMKFLGRNPRTRSQLSHWSGKLPLVTAHFYFWNSGSPVQMSLEGFYRTVIHAVSSGRPELIPESLPDRWDNTKLFGEDRRNLSKRELEQAFETLVGKSGTTYKLCIFIDGLDEYEGNRGALVEQLSGIVSKYDVKLCVASRPWPVFETALSIGPHLMLQDLTFVDIVRFAWGKLHNHRGFKNLLAMEAEYTGNLVLEIARKADGVFLWVDLVIKSLLEGLANADRVADLQRRLEELPGDLEELYHKMFNSIETFYRHNASRYLQIARAGAGQMSALTFYFADEGDGNKALETKIQVLTEEQRLARYQTIKTRLNGSCKGFLEIPNPVALVEGSSADLEDPPPQETHPADVDDESSVREKGEPVKEVIAEPDRKVTYLHRTAKDFLESSSMRQKILNISPVGFNPHLAILGGHLLLLKTLPAKGTDRVALWRVVLNFLHTTAAESEASFTELSLTQYLDELERTAEFQFRTNGFSSDNLHWTATRRTSATDSQHEAGFMALAAEFNLGRYIISKMELGIPLFSSSDGRPILDYVVEDFAKYPALCEPSPGMVPTKGGGSTATKLPNLRIIKTLLDRGESPNARYKDLTTWERVLEEASKMAKNPAIEGDSDIKIMILEHWAAIVDTFIAHDADPVPNRNSPLGSKIREVFGPCIPQRAKELEKKLKRTRSRWSSIGKFITPRNRNLEKLTFETRPLPILLRMKSATMAPLGWSEFLYGNPAAAARTANETSDSSPSTSNNTCVRNYRPRDIDTFSPENHPSELMRGRAKEGRTLEHGAPTDHYIPDPRSYPPHQPFPFVHISSSDEDPNHTLNAADYPQTMNESSSVSGTEPAIDIRTPRARRRAHYAARRQREPAEVTRPTPFGPHMSGNIQELKLLATRQHLELIYRLSYGLRWSDAMIVSIAERKRISMDSVKGWYMERQVFPEREIAIVVRMHDEINKKEKQKKKSIDKTAERRLLDVAPSGIPQVLAPYLSSGPIVVQQEGEYREKENMMGKEVKQHADELYKYEVTYTTGDHVDEVEMRFIRQIRAIETSTLETSEKMSAARRIGERWREEDSRPTTHASPDQESREVIW